MTGMEVIDSAVKIGLGALISAVASFVMLKRSQSHELAKDKASQQRELAACKKSLYVDFLTTSGVLVQKYRESQCRANEEDYFTYLKLYNEVQLIADEQLRICAFGLLNAVNAFITFPKKDKDSDDHELFKSMRAAVDERIGHFQLMAKQDINAPE